MGNKESNILNHPVLDEELKKTWEILSDYVEKICMGRDPSHGHAHMEKVAIDTVTIIIKETKCNCPCFKMAVYFSMIIAWLHDICDHKYDPEKKLKENISKFLVTKLNLNEHYIIAIHAAIDNISFSKENKMRQKGMTNKEIENEWEKSMGSDFVRYRNFVSDADKLSAIGKDGLVRCIEYTKTRYKEKHGKEMSYNELVSDVQQHAKDKLLRLSSEFIKTNTGKEMAKPLHQELVEKLKKLQNEVTYELTSQGS